MGFFSGIKGITSKLSGLVSGGASAAGSGLLGATSAAANAKIQYSNSKKLAFQSPYWHRKGLEKANLNPILALNPSGGSPSAGMPSGYAPDIAGSAKSMADKRLKNEQQKIAEADAITSGANSAIALQRMRWNEKTYNYMQQNDRGFLLKMSALKEAGLMPKDMGEAAVFNAVMAPSASKLQKKKSSPYIQYKNNPAKNMGIPIWR